MSQPPLYKIRQFLNHRFSLQEDKVEDTEIVESVRRNVDFKGVHLWALVFAIFIASIGLNVNSTAVIIGAMLISPIMGPVMGIGLGIGINDLVLVKKGAKNLLVATAISIIASAAYFTITPLHQAQSELLSRTSPSLWDVFIALFGGLAGMVAASRKEKSNVIPGVAIATALMPPLCTAGFGIAMHQWSFFLGALYLYFINSVFIAIATYLMSRYLKMEKKHFDDSGSERRVTHYMIIIVIITILPSIVMAVRIVKKSIFETNAQKFVEEQFRFSKTQVVSQSYTYTGKVNSINLLLIGAELEPRLIDTLRNKLANYQLKGVKLNIRQGLNARQQIDLSQIKASILQDVFSSMPQQDTVKLNEQPPAPSPDTAVLAELKVLYPAIRSFGLSHVIMHQANTTQADTLHLAVAHFTRPLRRADQAKLQRWLGVRYQTTRLRLITE